MKQSLDLRLGQHLTITPQLQQAIRLLQLSAIELQQEIQEQLESNPLLEEEEPGEGARETAEAESASGEPAESAEVTATPEGDGMDATDLDMEQRTLDEDMRGDTEWDDRDDMDMSAAPTSRHDDSLPDFESRSSIPTSLRDHLLWQVQMMPMSPVDRSIAVALIDEIDEDGYLSCSLEEIQQMLAKEHKVELDEVEAVLHQIHNFDPLGVGARDLSECLRLQLRARHGTHPAIEAALALATPEHLAELGSRDYTSLKRALKLQTDDLQSAITLIQSLDPRPGSRVAPTHAPYVTPDVTVRKVRGIWRAELNGDSSPRLRINRQYEGMIHRGDSSTQNKYLQDQLQQARWLIKSLASRSDTLLKVSRTIVERQRAFFDHGPEAMKPLVLHDVAEAVGMHESTISRVTTNKYMLTPRGVFELKYFFSSHVGTVDGGACSATAIRSMIKKLVGAEPPTKPISDSRIAEILSESGIQVARRTVAKYREFMNIPPSSLRRSLTQPRR
ncbi:MAG: RNA polymerase factor sigma-54 [Candidatus Muproteobacteria bacterium RBG_16_62_13]|uniref:RNA polymerase sigma-54 factor n=1 Tax=Candidatus Muproteobacteria bacterium RBG_16_62_13 TaxID=1817756 RepID=A0A1F6SZK3_9PROT|nr:MAG: RNA polymerase factor sigma-54 [Candidatus Muproteobacteria bacterium RBG_16_62_13]